jgi:hypothetical protein
MDAPAFYLFISLAGLNPQPWWERDPLQRIFALYQSMTLKQTRVEIKDYKEVFASASVHAATKRFVRRLVSITCVQRKRETYRSPPSST